MTGSRARRDLEGGRQVRGRLVQNDLLPAGEDRAAVDAAQPAGVVQVGGQQVDHPLAPQLEALATGGEGQNRDPRWRRGVCRQLRPGPAGRVSLREEDVQAGNPEQQ